VWLNLAANALGVSCRGGLAGCQRPGRAAVVGFDTKVPGREDVDQLSRVSGEEVAVVWFGWPFWLLARASFTLLFPGYCVGIDKLALWVQVFCCVGIVLLCW